MEKICALSGQKFTVTESDQRFYEQVGFPIPDICPTERQRQRLAWRNESHLYWRNCDGTGERVLSVFAPESPYTVYDYDYWISDQWNPMDYGRDFDFSRPFFEQFGELLLAVPQVARSAFDNVNSPYVNQAGQNKNAYMIFEADYTEDCAYCWHITDSQRCLDCDYLERCQDCYGCVSCLDCTNLKYSENCTDCHHSYFLKNCKNCRHCFGSINLQDKEFYFYNQPLNQEEYFAKLMTLGLETTSGIQNQRQVAQEFFETQPHPHCNGFENQESTGDYLYNCQNCQDCYFLVDSQNCRYVTESRNVKNTHDMDTFGSRNGVNSCYQVMEIGGKAENVYFSEQVWHRCGRIYYSKCCLNHSYDLFGCIGLRNAQYCILNKQYSETEYFQLRDKIIDHMGETGEYSHYFPKELSPFGYNETVAQEYYPLLRSEALDQGFKWAPIPEEKYDGPSHATPDSIKDADLTICDQILNCQSTNKNYRILQSEYNFYKTHNLPIPTLCPMERHRLRDDLRNRRRLFERHCAECHTALQTTYGPERVETILCDSCYR